MPKPSSDIQTFLTQIESKFKGSTTLELGDIEQQAPRAITEWRRNHGGLLEFRYSFEMDGESIFGGLEFQPLKQLKEDCKAWAEETWVAQNEIQKPIWDKAVPFTWLQNGDFLAFAIATRDDAPIVYLSHDDESWKIANSFADFIREWTRIGFLGPESWILEPFLDTETRLLRHDTEAGQEPLSMFAKAGIKLPA